MSRRPFKVFRDFFRLAALPCRDAAALISQSMDGSLPWADRLALKAHLWICRLCRRYHGQLHFLRRTLRRWDSLEAPCDMPELPDVARDRMKARLAEAMKRPS